LSSPAEETQVKNLKFDEKNKTTEENISTTGCINKSIHKMLIFYHSRRRIERSFLIQGK
jgi:hypothetical protein